jgi:hypothetical protein
VCYIPHPSYPPWDIIIHYNKTKWGVDPIEPMVLQKAKNFLNSWAIFSFSSRTQFHGIVIQHGCVCVRARVVLGGGTAFRRIKIDVDILCCNCHHFWWRRKRFGYSLSPEARDHDRNYECRVSEWIMPVKQVRWHLCARYTEVKSGHVCCACVKSVCRKHAKKTAIINCLACCYIQRQWRNTTLIYCSNEIWQGG